MFEPVLPYAPTLFIVCGYGVAKLGGWLRRSGPHSALVLWCARMKCLSVVDTEGTTSETGQSEKVTHCLLWPELKDCDQRCIK
jgi:hypothetical protein